MLNELKEFEAYVTKPESPNPRVQPKMLTDHFYEKDSYLMGIEEIMTVIARGYLFSKEHQIYSQEGQINENVIEDAIELLHRWTGFADTKYRARTENAQLEKWMKKHSVKDGWLKKYWIFQYQKFEEGKKTKQSKKEIKQKSEVCWQEIEKKWNKSFNSPMDYSAIKITYKNVIANALEKGPLRNRYLVMKRSEEQVGKKFKKSESKPFSYLTDKSCRQATSDTKIIKIIATYLMNKENHPGGQNEIWIKSSDLSRWYAQDDSKNGLESWYPKNVTWNGKHIYAFKNLFRRYTKVIIDQEYLREYDFHIIDSKDAKLYKDTYWILEDAGHGLEDCWIIK